MKKLIIVTVFIICLALCAAVWSRTRTVEETPAPFQVTVVSAPEPTVENIAAGAETMPPTEKEKIEFPQPQAKPFYESIPESEPVPEEVPIIAEVHPTPEPEPEPVSVPEPTSAPVPTQTVTHPKPGDMVYVPGFGWLECQGPGEVIHDESIYENGNKIGIMG